MHSIPNYIIMSDPNSIYFSLLIGADRILISLLVYEGCKFQKNILEFFLNFENNIEQMTFSLRKSHQRISGESRLFLYNSGCL